MAIQITPSLLNKLKEKAEKATPGEWLHCFARGRWEGWIIDEQHRDILKEVSNFRENAAFIAAANPAVVLALIDHIKQMETELDAVRYDEAHESGMRMRTERELAWTCNMLDHVCASFPSCNNCPLPKCKTDNPDFRQMASDAIDEEDEDIDAEVEAMNR